MIVSVSVYEAACQSRFSSPEIIAILGDVVRRLRRLKGTKTVIGKGTRHISSQVHRAGKQAQGFGAGLPRGTWRRIVA